MVLVLVVVVFRLRTLGCIWRVVLSCGGCLWVVVLSLVVMFEFKLGLYMVVVGGGWLVAMVRWWLCMLRGETREKK